MTAKSWEAVASELAAAGVFVPPRELSSLRYLAVEAPCSLPRCELFGRIRVGAYTYIGRGSELRNVAFGRFCSVARNIIVGATEHPTELLTTHPIAFGGGEAFKSDPYFLALKKRQGSDGTGRSETSIGNDVWIGDSVFIRRGVTVGDGAVLAARALVHRDVAPYTILGGVPAKPIRSRFPEELCARLLETRWWNLDLRQVETDWTDPAQTTHWIATREPGQEPAELRPRAFTVERSGGEWRLTEHETLPG
jgi:acetyltransferase-like isoleucine patch superfamily enzyme